MKNIRINSEQMADKKWYPRATIFDSTSSTDSAFRDGIITPVNDTTPFDSKKEADEYLKQMFKNSEYHIELI